MDLGLKKEASFDWQSYLLDGRWVVEGLEAGVGRW